MSQAILLLSGFGCVTHLYALFATRRGVNTRLGACRLLCKSKFRYNHFITISNITLPFLLNIFSGFLQPGVLYKVIVFFTSATILFVGLTYLHLYRKKKGFFTRKSIEKSLELWLSKVMLEDEDAEKPIIIPAKFTKHFRNPAKRQFAINELLNMKRNFTGYTGDNIIKLYLQSGFKKDSMSKFRSTVWHKKAKGINELYVMNQQDMIPKIFKHTNHYNEIVRMEAQTAMIGFLGFEGLRFLDVVTQPVSDWQQVKILEQLKTLDPGEMKNIGTWLQSPNDTVVIFALKLTDVYQQFQVYDEVVSCLAHTNSKVRMLAVKTLVRIDNETTAAVLTSQYSKEAGVNRYAILGAIKRVATENEQLFLTTQLSDEDDLIKLEAAKVLAYCCVDGLDILKQKAAENAEPYEQIYRHVKRELQR